jgi:quinol monooxygenase YgiN
MPDDTQREKRNREAGPMVIIAGYVLVDEGQRDAYVEAHRDLVERARAFEGCIDLAITADPVDRRRVNNLEVWASAEALDAWRAEANHRGPASNSPTCGCGASTPKTVARSSGPRGRAHGLAQVSL